MGNLDTSPGTVDVPGGAASSGGGAASTAGGDANTTGAGDGASTGGGDGAPPLIGTPTQEGLRVAFIGDQGNGEDSVAVRELIESEGADFVLIAGDFDYEDDPNLWEEENVEGFGSDYPIFAVVGNHDKAEFDGYQEKLVERLQHALADGAACTGEIGGNSACTYRGLFMAMSGVDVTDGQAESEDHLRAELEANDAIWSICLWHKNQTDMQLGSKTNDAGWGVYQACQDEGAIIITGHEHTYSRTLTLTNLGNGDDGHGATGVFDLVTVGEGSTFVSVVGTGGRGLRDYEADKHDDDTWWASFYTSNLCKMNGGVIDDCDESPGALFIDFYVDGDPYKARGYVKTINGTIMDEYEIIREPMAEKS
ncbi:metallophosphoesterase [Paraliomyxa miuraensis]|uniref:metallophosphoesterase n=1 Tax=Paraliomyxa miuraensis TaxID=376150 RepID=UPI002256A397|nr:metallophosphoesterase [Paraliomyxa miuraensis]MCX4241376.1 metallophosphoesterase [Paraliomyxa miuraensis]